MKRGYMRLPECSLGQQQQKQHQFSLGLPFCDDVISHEQSRMHTRLLKLCSLLFVLWSLTSESGIGFVLYVSPPLLASNLSSPKQFILGVVKGCLIILSSITLWQVFHHRASKLPVGKKLP